MNKVAKLLPVLGLVLFGSFQVRAATEVDAALDLLRLPSENRRMVLQQTIANDVFKQLTTVAFDEKQSMRLRWKALVSLAESDPKKALPHLLRASENSEWYMRNAALVALSDTQPLKAEAVAKKLLKDKALVVRSAAVEVLKKFPSEQNRDLLWSELDEDYNFKKQASLWIRPQILKLLSEKPMDRELKIFVRMLRDRDTQVGVAAIHGLQKLTGTSLGTAGMPAEKQISLWQNYVKTEKLAL